MRTEFVVGAAAAASDFSQKNNCSAFFAMFQIIAVHNAHWRDTVFHSLCVIIVLGWVENNHHTEFFKLQQSRCKRFCKN